MPVSTADVAAERSGPPLRVAYVLKRFPRLSQTFVFEEMLELERRGVELVVVAGRDSGEPVEHPRVRLLRAPVLRPGNDPGAVAGVLLEADVRHVHAHFATWAAETARRASATAGLPFSFTAHATDIFRADVDRAALAGRIADAAFVVTVTEHNRRHLDDLLRREALAGTVRLLHNGVDTARLAPAPHPRAHRVVAVGRLVEKKGFADLLRALALLRDGGRPVPALVIGDGPERARLEALRDDLGLGDLVELPGAWTQDRTVAAVRRSAVLALPCVVTADGDRDALPTVVLEAMALGTPVVATRVSGLPEMVEHGRSGLLVEPHDPASLADAVAEVLADPIRGAALASAARSRVVQSFSLSRNVARLHEMFAAA